jgi:hypothetical protein
MGRTKGKSLFSFYNNSNVLFSDVSTGLLSMHDYLQLFQCSAYLHTPSTLIVIRVIVKVLLVAGKVTS